MSVTFILGILINSLIWYAFLYYLLYAIKKTVNLYAAALILFVLGSLAFVSCPFMQPIIETVLMDQGMMGDGDMMDQELNPDVIE